MRPYPIGKRFGRPQFLAGALLLVFLAQASWLVYAELRSGNPPDGTEFILISEGWKQWRGHGIAGAPMREVPNQSTSDDMLFHNLGIEDGFDTVHSPLLYLVSTAPLLPLDLNHSVLYWRLLPRLPFLFCGVFLGASLWYVARRLCGNTGGFIALTFYCFSPAIIQASAMWHTSPDITAAWGAFGTIFTAIAVAHTLYAPREVVWWNWRRILLLGVALAIAVGSQFPMIVLLPITLGFLLYVVPVRQRAGLVIWLAACAIAFILLFASYFFHPHAFAESMRRAVFWGATWRGFVVPGVYKQIAIQIERASPVLAFALPVAVVTYAAWPCTRYFGNTAPLLVALVFLALGMAHPDLAGAGFLLAAVPFLFIFVSGVLADLLETRHRLLVGACIVGMMAAYAVWNLISLAQVPRG